MATNPNYLVYIQQFSAANSAGPAISITAPIPDSVMFDTESTYTPLMPQGFTSNKTINTAAAAFGMKLAVQGITAQLWDGSTPGDLSLDLEFHTESDPIGDVRNPIVNLMKLVTPGVSSSSGLLDSPGPQLDLQSLIQLAKDALQQGESIGNIGTTSVGNPSAGFIGNNTFNIPTPNGLGGLASGLSTGLSQGIAQAKSAIPSAMIDAGKQAVNGNNSAVFTSNTQNPSIGTAAYWKTLIKNRVSIKIGNYLYFDAVVITQLSQTFSSNFDAVTGLPHHVKVQVRFRPMFILTQADLENIYINPNANSTPGNNSYGFNFPPLTTAHSI